MRRHVRTVAPAAEPLLLADVKLHLRVEHNADDALITALIQAAREQAEDYTGRALITQTWALTDDAPTDPLLLPRWPALSIVSVTDDAVATSAYTSYLGDEAQLVPTSGWGGTVIVTYTAGYGAAGSAVPAALKQWMLLQIGQWYENREGVAVVGAASVPQRLPFVDALLSPYRIRLLGLD